MPDILFTTEDTEDTEDTEAKRDKNRPEIPPPRIFKGYYLCVLCGFCGSNQALITLPTLQRHGAYNKADKLKIRNTHDLSRR
jgi:hypothetical protein